MLNRVFNFVRNIFVTRPIQYSEEHNENERHIISRKRSRDVQNGENSSPSKRICLETGTEVKESRPLQSLPIDSPLFMKPDLRKKYQTMSMKNKPDPTDSMDFKGHGAAGFSSLRTPNHGKENNVIEISDEDDICQQHVNTRSSMKGRDGGSPWVDAVPNLNPTCKSFQRSCYKVKDKRVEDDNLPSNSTDVDFTSGQLQWRRLESRPILNSRWQNRFGKLKMGHRPKRIDNKQYTPLPPSATRGVEETIRLEEKNHYSKLLKHYETHSTERTLPSNGLYNTRTSRFSGVFNNHATPLVTFTKTSGKIEFIDLTTRMKEHVPKVRRDQEAKPQTLASKIANGPVEIATTSRPIPPVSKMNSLEEILKSNSYCKPMYLEDTLKKFEEKKRETEKNLKEPLLRAERYARQNEYDMKQIEERMRRHIRITESEVILEEIPEEAKLPVLTPRMQGAIDGALVSTPSHATLVEAFSLKITRRDMSTLANLNWLNDEVINYYMNLLIERGKMEKYPSVYAFNTFFYSKLVTTGYATLKRWTRKIDIFSYDLIIVPVHLGVHWCMAAIDFRDKTVQYFDSMGNPNHKCLQALVQYLEDESMDKKKVAYNTSSWKKINVKDNPHQMNGSDCGVFACMYAEYICRNAKISFTQANMPYFRRKMVFEILSAKLLECS